MRVLLAVLFLTTACSSFRMQKDARIDHVNLAVNDLKESKKQFSEEGFFVQEGRMQKNSQQNAFVHMRNFTEIELVTASRRLDSSSGWYTDFLEHHPNELAFVVIGVDSKSALKDLYDTFTARGYHLEYNSYPYADVAEFATTSSLHPISFIWYHSPKATPANLYDHPNQTNELVGVWMSNGQILKDLGITEFNEIEKPFLTEKVQEAKMKNASFYILPASSDKRFTGLSLATKDLQYWIDLLQKMGRKDSKIYDTAQGRTLYVPANNKQNYFLEIIEKNVDSKGK